MNIPAAPHTPARTNQESVMPGLSRLIRTEAKLVLREPAAVFFSLVFGPLLLVVLGGVPAFRRPDPHLGGLTVIDVYVPTLIVLALSMASMNALPQFLAGYRERGVLRRMSTTPVHPAALLLAQLVINLSVAAVSLILVVCLGRIVFSARFAADAPGFVLSLVLTALALFAIGLTVAALAPSSKVAGPVGSVLTFPMMFFAGLWVPLAAMPATLRRIGEFTPLGAAAQALQSSWAGHSPRLLDLGVMAAYAVVFGAVAAKTFRWE